MKFASTIFVLILVASGSAGQSKCDRELAGVRLGMSVAQARAVYPVMPLIEAKGKEYIVIVTPGFVPDGFDNVSAELRFIDGRLSQISAIYARSKVTTDEWVDWASHVCKSDAPVFGMEGGYDFGWISDGAANCSFAEKAEGTHSSVHTWRQV